MAQEKKQFAGAQDKKYVFFDLDGTLTDPKPGVINSFVYTLRHFGIEIADTDLLVKYIGPPLIISYYKIFNNDTFKASQAVNIHTDYSATIGVYQNNIFEGVEAMLTDLKAKGKCLAIATSRHQHVAKRILDYFNISRFFNLILGYDDGCGMTGDKTQLVRYGMMSLGATPQHSIMIGDRNYDIIGAKNNGVDSIGVLYGYGSRSELSHAGATYLAKSVSQLKNLLL